MQVVLEIGRTVSVNITDSYVHRSSVVHYTGSGHSDVQRRGSVAQIMMLPIKWRILNNKFISVDAKRCVVLSMALGKHLFGSGAWALTTHAEKQLFESSYMSILRQACWGIVGYSSAGLTDKQVCEILRMLTPVEALRVERVRFLASAVKHDCGYLRAVLAVDDTWFPEVLSAFDALKQACWVDLVVPSADDSLAVWQFLSSAKFQGRLVKCALKRYRKWRLHNRDAARDWSMQRAKQLALAEKRGVAVCHFRHNRSEGCVPCPTCGKTFAKLSAMCSHANKAHGNRSELTLLAKGSICQVCMTEHHTSRRLKSHLYAVKRCRDVYINADLGCTGGTSERSRAAWRPPLPASGPHPWWATLQPPIC